MTLEDEIREAFELGGTSITLRVSLYKSDTRTPSTFQSYIDPRDWRSARAVGTGEDPVTALKAALAESAKLLTEARGEVEKPKHVRKSRPAPDPDEDLLGPA